MAQCLIADPAASGALYATAADPCTTLLALTPAEYAALAETPWRLSPAEGLEVSGAILSVWAVGWGMRQLWNALSLGGDVRE